MNLINILITFLIISSLLLFSQEYIKDQFSQFEFEFRNKVELSTSNGFLKINQAFKKQKVVVGVENELFGEDSEGDVSILVDQILEQQKKQQLENDKNLEQGKSVVMLFGESGIVRYQSGIRQLNEIYFKIAKFLQIPNTLSNGQYLSLFGIKKFTNEDKFQEMDFFYLITGLFYMNFQFSLGKSEFLGGRFEQTEVGRVDNVLLDLFFTDNFLINGLEMFVYQITCWLAALLFYLIIRDKKDLTYGNSCLVRISCFFTSQIVRAYNLTFNLLIISALIQIQYFKMDTTYQIVGFCFCLISLILFFLAYIGSFFYLRKLQQMENSEEKIQLYACLSYLIDDLDIENILGFENYKELTEDQKELEKDKQKMENQTLEVKQQESMVGLKRILTIYYRFFSLLKKCLIVIIAFFVEDEVITLAVFLTIEAIFLLLNLYARPYKNFYQIAVKTIIQGGQILLLIFFQQRLATELEYAYIIQYVNIFIKNIFIMDSKTKTYNFCVKYSNILDQNKIKQNTQEQIELTQTQDQNYHQGQYQNGLNQENQEQDQTQEYYGQNQDQYQNQVYQNQNQQQLKNKDQENYMLQVRKNVTQFSLNDQNNENQNEEGLQQCKTVLNYEVSNSRIIPNDLSDLKENLVKKEDSNTKGTFNENDLFKKLLENAPSLEQLNWEVLNQNLELKQKQQENKKDCFIFKKNNKNENSFYSETDFYSLNKKNEDQQQSKDLSLQDFFKEQKNKQLFLNSLQNFEVKEFNEIKKANGKEFCLIKLDPIFQKLKYSYDSNLFQQFTNTFIQFHFDNFNYNKISQKKQEKNQNQLQGETVSYIIEKQPYIFNQVSITLHHSNNFAYTNSYKMINFKLENEAIERKIEIIQKQDLPKFEKTQTENISKIQIHIGNHDIKKFLKQNYLYSNKFQIQYQSTITEMIQQDNFLKTVVKETDRLSNENFIILTVEALQNDLIQDQISLTSFIAQMQVNNQIPNKEAFEQIQQKQNFIYPYSIEQIHYQYNVIN